MDENSTAITLLCSRVCADEGVLPLTAREWSVIAARLAGLGKQPGELLSFSEKDFEAEMGLDNAMAERCMRLIDRSASLSFELSRYRSMGIDVVTLADAGYPERLRKTLANGCPPLFYFAGALKLLETPSVGYVGSRSVTRADVDFTRRTATKTVSRGYSVVSGGARGVDSTAADEALNMGGAAVEYISDSMLKRLKNPDAAGALSEGRLLLLSAMKPDAGFDAGMAMMRNKFIYIQSSGTVVIRADENRGGTWSGAMENLKHGWRTLFCWNNAEYPGNSALIRMGARAIDESWDGDAGAVKREQTEQLSFL